MTKKQYLRSHEIWKQIFERGEKWAKELGIKDKEDVDRLIHEFRMRIRPASEQRPDFQ
ncbi:hypothetical protein ACFL6S_21945 [Candidatus Poribacteria bacterium]